MTQLKDMGVRKILALEMEAATIATVAHEREVPQWLVAKGVMDHANFDKDDRIKEFAARASAEVLFALLGHIHKLVVVNPARLILMPRPQRHRPQPWSASRGGRLAPGRATAHGVSVDPAAARHLDRHSGHR